MKVQKLLSLLLLGLVVLASCQRPAAESGTDPQQLNHTWVLQSLQGQAVAAGQAGRLPRLTFDLSQNRVSGHTGCNRLSGGATVRGRQIIFSRMITTKMACPGESMEQPFLSILNDSTLTFRLQDSELTLLQGQTPVLVFRKED
ncbi:MAG: META domain-containing protein [Adhaeribacter sp.]